MPKTIGRTFDTSFSVDFLKEALSNGQFDLPFRGPEVFVNSDNTYVCSVVFSRL